MRGPSPASSTRPSLAARDRCLTLLATGMLSKHRTRVVARRPRMLSRRYARWEDGCPPPTHAEGRGGSLRCSLGICTGGHSAADDLGVARRTTRRTLDPRPDGSYDPWVQKCRDDIVVMAGLGRSPEGIAASVGVSRHQVGRVLRAYVKEHGSLPTPEELDARRVAAGLPTLAEAEAAMLASSYTLAEWLGMREASGDPQASVLLAERGLAVLDAHDLDA